MLTHLSARTGIVLSLAAVAMPSVAAPKPAPAKPAPKPSVAAPKSSAAKKAPAKPAAKPAAKPVELGKTPSETVARLIGFMQKRNREGIAGMFDWQRFAKEMNSLIPDSKGLEAATYKTLLVETLDVPEDVSKNLRVGKQTMKGKDNATVQMERMFPSGTDKSASGQYKPINVLSLYRTAAGWKIYRLDSAQETVVTPPPPARAPQGMVPAADGDAPKLPLPPPAPKPSDEVSPKDSAK